MKRPRDEKVAAAIYRRLFNGPDPLALRIVIARGGEPDPIREIKDAIIQAMKRARRPHP